MNETKTIETKDLTGAALDWAVDWIETGAPQDHDDFVMRSADESYSSNWAQGGPIIDRELIQIEPEWHNQHCAVSQDWKERGFGADHGWHWLAHILGPYNLDDPHSQEGGTPLIAAMRCYVASKLGAQVEVPAELVA